MEQFGRYQVLEEIARGGMGVVYRGYDPQRGFEVAIKLLLAGRNATEQARKRFLREARALGKLRHAHIVAVYDVSEHEGDPYMVMELLRAESLQARLDASGPLPIAEAVAIATKIAEALHHAHGQGILHRDVKPENVVIDARGEPILVDFGITRDLDPTSSLSALSVHGRCMGTPGYWPPEQARGDLDSLGPHSDVYALGATLVGLLTGKPPHGEPESLVEALVHATRPAAPPSARRPEIPVDLDAVCLRSLALEPADRYPDARAFAADLDAVAQGRSPVAARPGSAAGAPARAQLAVALAIGALTVVATAGILRYRFPTPAPTRPRTAALEDGAAQPESAALPEPTRSAVEAANPASTPVESASPPPTADEGRLALAEAAFERGNRELQAERYRQAISDYDEAIRLQPDFAKAYMNRGAAWVQLGDVQGAIADFDEAIRLKPDCTTAYSHRASARWKLADWGGAMADYDEAIRRSPGEAETYLSRGNARGYLGDFQGAIADYGDVLRLDPNRAEVYRMRGNARVYQGDYQGAIEDYGEAIRLEPGEAEAYSSRGNARTYQGDLHGAIVDYDAALRLKPNQAQVYSDRGNTRTRLGDYQGAIADFDHAIRSRPDFAEAIADRGFARGGLGDFQGAIVDMERALALEPDASWAPRIRQALSVARARVAGR